MQKSSQIWTNNSGYYCDDHLKNWSQVTLRLGYDPKTTNISFRIKEWLKFHHIDAYFDYLMGTPNSFYNNSYENNILSINTVNVDQRAFNSVGQLTLIVSNLEQRCRTYQEQILEKDQEIKRLERKLKIISDWYHSLNLAP